jgi:hypothetical protein
LGTIVYVVRLSKIPYSGQEQKRPSTVCIISWIKGNGNGYRHKNRFNMQKLVTNRICLFFLGMAKPCAAHLELFVLRRKTILHSLSSSFFNWGRSKCGTWYGLPWYSSSETGKCQSPTTMSHFATFLSSFCDTCLTIWHFFFSPKLGLKNQKHCCKFAQFRQRQKIIVRNQLMYSICLKLIPSLVTKCWCLCQSQKKS